MRRTHFAANALTALIVIALIMAVFVARGINRFNAEGPLAENASFTVNAGERLGSVAEKLEAAGAIDDVTTFRIGARYTGLDQKLRFGEYEIPAGSSMRQILELLSSGRAILHRIAIPEGLTSWQIVELLKASDLLTGEVVSIPREGWLAPDTYLVQRGETRQQLLDRMEEAQKRILAEAWENRTEGLPLRTPEEALILASIVEKETGISGERAEVASVFENRLNRGMKLQTDPTVIYGITLGKGSLGRGLRKSELRKATPYNTYVIEALPPTPIANPGREAIAAVMNPAETDYLFFVADGTGGHAFAKTLVEHNRNVANWRKIERERNKN